jgi:hypothetical protein
VAVNPGEVVQDAQAVPVRELSLIGLNRLERPDDLRRQVAVSRGLAVPLGMCLPDRPFQPRRIRRRVLPRDENCYGVEAVVERGAQFVEQLTEDD